MNTAEKFTTLNEKISQVHDMGVREGKKSAYDEFWDNYQENGSKTRYECAFAEWRVENFKPKYDLKPTSAYMMFRGFDSNLKTQYKGDIPKLLEECGVVLDTSQCTNFQYMFMNSFVTHIGVIDTRSADTLYQPFSANRYHTFDKLILREDGSQTFGANPFNGATALKNIVIEGAIGMSLSFQWCPLTIESLKSIITHLKNYKGTENEGTYTLTLSSDSKTLLDSETDYPEGVSWENYITGYLGWNLA